MPKPNTDPLLVPQRRKRVPAKPRNDRGDNEKSSKAEDTLFKGKPPPSSPGLKAPSEGDRQ